MAAPRATIWMVIRLQIDESLLRDPSPYQDVSDDVNPVVFPSELKLFPWNDINEVTDKIHRATRIAPRRQRLYFRGREITADLFSGKQSNHRRSHTLSWFGITDRCSLFLQCQRASESVPIVPFGLCSVLSPNTDSNSNSAQTCRKLIADCT